MKQVLSRTFATLLLLTLLALQAAAGVLKGTIIDKTNREPLTGATVQLVGTTNGAVADLDGNYQLDNLKSGTYTIAVKYVGYKDIIQTEVNITATGLMLPFEMEPDAQILSEVAVVAQLKRNTDVALMADQRRSLMGQSGVSAQQIS